MRGLSRRQSHFNAVLNSLLFVKRREIIFRTIEREKNKQQGSVELSGGLTMTEK